MTPMRNLCFGFLLLTTIAACGGETPATQTDASAADVTDVADVTAADVTDASVTDVTDVTPVDVTDVTPADAADVTDAAPIDAGPGLPVRFAFKPGWEGVRSVEVVGSFGRADDWTAPFATMTLDGDTWRGTGELHPGTYGYAFRVIGDSAAGSTATSLSRFVHDPSNLRSGRCPAGSLLATMSEMNPCAILFVPQSKNPTRFFAVRGRAVTGTTAAPGWLAFIERAEPGQNPFFVDRATADSDGRFTFQVALGQYRVVLKNPTALSAPDTARSVAGTASFISADTDLAPVDVSGAH